MKKTKKQRVGDLGEEIVKNFFEKKGYKIIERNYRKVFGELDLIMKKDGEIYFMEVKTIKIGSSFKRPEEHLTKDKIRRFEKTGLFYLREKKLEKRKNPFGIEEKIKSHF